MGGGGKCVGDMCRGVANFGEIFEKSEIHGTRKFLKNIFFFPRTQIFFFLIKILTICVFFFFFFFFFFFVCFFSSCLELA